MDETTERRTNGRGRDGRVLTACSELRRREVDGLSDAEALAGVLEGARALERAARLLDDRGGLRGLTRLGFGEAVELLGARPARRLVCALALGRRVQASLDEPRHHVDDSAAVARWARGRLAYLEHEELWLLALDGRNRVLAARCLARGGPHALSLAPKDVLIQGLRENARALVLVHNHPSGDPAPSAADTRFTREVADAGAIVGLPLLDHVVVAGERFASVPFPPPRAVTPTQATPGEARVR
ncbi:MAG: DNA repair protein [Myxococcales bacterium]|jgi:DNA repair protein RadC|nr:DNA repair protein [Myxococcales bacterium]MBL0193087.1 DNA repair protein [Myxococcales bacterium]HQY60010.1 JAB domain-containing protein [Polyangiaceae bacterium]